MEPKSKISTSYRWKISKYVISKYEYDKCYLKYARGSQFHMNRLKFSSTSTFNILNINIYIIINFLKSLII